MTRHYKVPVYSLSRVEQRRREIALEKKIVLEMSQQDQKGIKLLQALVRDSMMALSNGAMGLSERPYWEKIKKLLSE